MLLQTATRELELGLLLLVVALVGLVSYWVYRDADARGMADAGYWGAAVGVAFVVGLIVGGLVAVAVYRSSRPDGYEGGQDPFADLTADDDEQPDRAHADLPPVPGLTVERVERASPTTLRGYARRYDDVNAAGDPEQLRTALRELVERGEAAETLGTGGEEPAEPPAPGEAADTRRHVGRPQAQKGGGTTAMPEESDDEPADANGASGDDPEFQWVEG